MKKSVERKIKARGEVGTTNLFFDQNKRSRKVALLPPLFLAFYSLIPEKKPLGEVFPHFQEGKNQQWTKKKPQLSRKEEKEMVFKVACERRLLATNGKSFFFLTCLSHILPTLVRDAARTPESEASCAPPNKPKTKKIEMGICCVSLVSGKWSVVVLKEEKQEEKKNPIMHSTRRGDRQERAASQRP